MYYHYCYLYLLFQVTDWLRTEGEEYLESHVTYGDNAAETEILTEDQNRFQRDFKVGHLPKILLKTVTNLRGLRSILNTFTIIIAAFFWISREIPIFYLLHQPKTDKTPCIHFVVVCFSLFLRFLNMSQDFSLLTKQCPNCRSRLMNHKSNESQSLFNTTFYVYLYILHFIILTCNTENGF